jgi:hypothetical protein
MKSFSESDRRIAPRQSVNLDIVLYARLSLVDSGLNDDEACERFQLLGSTRNISESGLSFIVRFGPIDEKYTSTIHEPLDVTIRVGGGYVEMKILPVYVKRINPEDPTEGSIIGAYFVQMTRVLRARLEEQLRRIR